MKNNKSLSYYIIKDLSENKFFYPWQYACSNAATNAAIKRVSNGMIQFSGRQCIVYCKSTNSYKPKSEKLWHEIRRVYIMNMHREKIHFEESASWEIMRKKMKRRDSFYETIVTIVTLIILFSAILYFLVN